jgi:hypothetical protein
MIFEIMGGIIIIMLVMIFFAILLVSRDITEVTHKLDKNKDDSPFGLSIASGGGHK